MSKKKKEEKWEYILNSDENSLQETDDLDGTTFCCGIGGVAGFSRGYMGLLSDSPNGREYWGDSYTDERKEKDSEYKNRIDEELPQVIKANKQHPRAFMLATLASGGDYEDQIVLAPILKKHGFKPIFDGINPNTRHRIITFKLDFVKNKCSRGKKKNVTKKSSTTRLLRGNRS